MPALRLRSGRRSSDEERSGLLFLERLGEGFRAGLRVKFARADALVNDLGAFGGGLDGAATFSTRILGAALLNLLLRPRRGMAKQIGVCGEDLRGCRCQNVSAMIEPLRSEGSCAKVAWRVCSV